MIQPIEVPTFVWEVGQGRMGVSRFVEAERFETVIEPNGEYSNRYYRFYTGDDLVASFDASDWDFVVRVDAAVTVEEAAVTETEEEEIVTFGDELTDYEFEQETTTTFTITQVFLFESSNVLLLNA